MDFATQFPETKVLQKAYQLRKKSKWFYFISGLLITGTIAWFFFKNHQEKQAKKAENAMYQAVYYFEQNDWKKALHGDDIYSGFLAIVQQFSHTKAANLAHFYIGNIYLYQQEQEKALTHFLQFKTKDPLLHPRTLSLIADIYCDQKKYKKAIIHYQKAADLYPNTDLNVMYLFKLALAYEATQQYTVAVQTLKKITQKYPKSIYYAEAKKHKYRLKTYLK